jgi:hypothetical protein
MFYPYFVSYENFTFLKSLAYFENPEFNLNIVPFFTIRVNYDYPDLPMKDVIKIDKPERARTDLASAMTTTLSIRLELRQ